jgi:dienelactone hydrolase
MTRGLDPRDGEGDARQTASLTVTLARKNRCNPLKSLKTGSEAEPAPEKMVANDIGVKQGKGFTVIASEARRSRSRAPRAPLDRRAPSGLAMTASGPTGRGPRSGLSQAAAFARKSRRNPLKSLKTGSGMFGRATRSAALRLFSLIALAALVTPTAASPASADQLATFTSASGEAIRGYLAKPAGAGPFPAVVLLHSCLGLPSNRRAIESALTGAGYVALFVDEFATRGLKETCTVDFPEIASDASGALAYLAGQPDVDPRRVAVVGFSQGGDGALAAAASPMSSPAFRAAAAFYPPCANEAGRRLAIPTLIVVGGADEVTPAADCLRLAEGQPKARLTVLPGAGHCFDDPAFAGGKRVLGMTLRYDPNAARRGMTELISFLHDSLAR